MTAKEYKTAANFWIEKRRNEMPIERLKTIVEEYLGENSVCALATGTGDYVRCTPLEYSFHDGKFWIFTEGGEKFIGLAENNNVSLAIFDKTPNFGELKSVQVMGKAEIIRPMSPEYISHGEFKGISAAALQNLSDQGRPMHLIAITPVRMDILFSEFKRQGYDSRQTLIF